MSSDGFELERRIQALEKEVRDIKEPLTATLMDLRSTISELENPFNYISKIIDVQPKEKERQEEAQRTSTKEKEPSLAQKNSPKNEATTSQTIPLLDQMNTNPWQLQLNILVVSDMLLKIFGKEELKRVMGEYVKDGWINREMAKAVEEAVDKIYADGLPPIVGRAGLEDHLLALYLLYRLSSQPSDPLLPVLLIFLNRVRSERREHSVPKESELEWR